MILHLFLILLGLALLVGGANVLIRGVSALAAAAGVPPVAIGLTVVAFGTSAPELVVNTMAAVHGQTDLAFGSIVGSCTVNIGWVLALTALARPLTVEPSIITREMPMMILATAAFIVMAADAPLDGAAVNQLDRGNGIILLLLFGVFLYYTARAVLMLPKTKREADPYLEEVTEAVERSTPAPRNAARSIWIYLSMTLIGIVGVAAGGRLTVFAAVRVAESLNVPQTIIGLTIISFGTTLPELTTGILATRRGESDIAIGNVVGSNIFNLLAAGGATAVIRPLSVPAGGATDLLMLATLSVLLLPIAIRGPRKITRAEGTFLLASYLAYTIWRGITAAAAAAA